MRRRPNEFPLSKAALGRGSPVVFRTPDNAMESKQRSCIRFFVWLCCLGVVASIPTSLVEEIKSSELRENKVKRAQPSPVEETGESYAKKLSAIKRGSNLKNPNPDQQILNEWSQAQDQALSENLDNIPSSLYNQDNPYDSKTIAEYEKGFQYGINKDKLDEALENAVLKSEYYGEPGAINQYRYYGAGDRRRKRRAVKKLRLPGRFKREVDLTPDEILAILNLYEKSRQSSDNYHPLWQNRFESGYNDEENDNQIDEANENWLETPVYPHVSRPSNDINSQYGYEDAGNYYEKRGKWGSYADVRNKRFMVAKKRNDPTRELRYLNGPSKNDFYTLNQLLSNQREPNVPLYHRLVL